MEPIRVVIFGRSILLAGLETIFRKNPIFSEIHRFETLSELEQFTVFPFDMVFLDSALPEAKIIPAMINHIPDLTIASLDMSDGIKVVYSEKSFTLTSMLELDNLLQLQIGARKLTGAQ